MINKLVNDTESTVTFLQGIEKIRIFRMKEKIQIGILPYYWSL